MFSKKKKKGFCSLPFEQYALRSEVSSPPIHPGVARCNLWNISLHSTLGLKVSYACMVNAGDKIFDKGRLREGKWRTGDVPNILPIQSNCIALLPPYSLYRILVFTVPLGTTVQCTLFTMGYDDTTTGLLWSPVFTCRQLRPTEIEWLPV